MQKRFVVFARNNGRYLLLCSSMVGDVANARVSGNSSRPRPKKEGTEGRAARFPRTCIYVYIDPYFRTLRTNRPKMDHSPFPRQNREKQRNLFAIDE